MQPTPSQDIPAGELASQSLWTSLRDAIRGTNADYTRIPLRRAVFLLAVPMVLELVLESTFAVVDIFFVARLGASAVATVGLTEAFLFLLYAVAMGLAMGITALVARRVGEAQLWMTVFGPGSEDRSGATFREKAAASFRRAAEILEKLSAQAPGEEAILIELALFGRLQGGGGHAATLSSRQRCSHSAERDSAAGSLARSL